MSIWGENVHSHPENEIKPAGLLNHQAKASSSSAASEPQNINPEAEKRVCSRAAPPALLVRDNLAEMPAAPASQHCDELA